MGVLDAPALARDANAKVSQRSGRALARPAWLRAAIAAAREPLTHFLVLGAALFLLWPVIADRVAPPPNLITISAGQVARAEEIFVKTHARPPGRDELADLVEQEIQSEVYYREGLALGLDRDDEIIRRRIAQKLKFMVQDIADQAAPSDADLQRFLDSHKADFAAEPQIGFSQIYLNPDRHGDALQQDATRLLARLNSGDGRLDYGRDSDVLPVPNDFESARLHEIAGIFGDDFAAAVAAQAPGRWVGPIRSGYGAHLVLVRTRIAGAAPQLAQVRADVLRAWQADRRSAANAEAYRQMRAKYAVKVDLPGNPAAAQ